MNPKKLVYVGTSDEQVRWGGNDDPRGVLEEGKAYTVIDWEVHSWHTKVTLEEFPDLRFNSASFTVAAD